MNVLEKRMYIFRLYAGTRFETVANGLKENRKTYLRSVISHKSLHNVTNKLSTQAI